MAKHTTGGVICGRFSPSNDALYREATVQLRQARRVKISLSLRR